MKTNASWFLLPVVSFLLFATSVFAAPPDSAIADAKAKYSQGTYSDAVAVLAKAETDNGDRDSKSALSDVYTEFALKEYLAQNYKNSYDCYRSALRLNPANQVAIRGYLKLKTDHGLTNLQNLGKPPVVARPEVVTPQVAEKPVVVAPPVEKPAVVVPPPVSPEIQQEKAQAAAELKTMMDKLQEAQQKFTEASSSALTNKAENDQLRRQVDDQKALVEKMLQAQAAAPNRTANPQDSIALQKTLKLLADIAAQNNTKPSQPQIVVQPDPALQELLKKVEADSKSSSGFNGSELIGVVLAGLLALVLIILVVLFALARRRSQKPVRFKNGFTSEVLPYQQPSGASATYLAERTRPALLEFVERDGPASENKDLALHQALIKADRLQKMYDDVRSGTITWDTVRKYIDELDMALRSEILKVVENRLSVGDLISNEAVLPILFPFLTDYDDFLRDKAEKLVKTALIEDQRGTVSDSDPLGVKALLVIPAKLESVMRGRDRTIVTARLSRSVAKELGLSAKDCLTVYRGALAHDAGYLMIDTDRLQAIMAKSEITEGDFEVIKSHASLGLNYFGEMELEQEIRDAILYHHERNDGSGYPSGLKKEEIPQIAKIIGVCETFATLLQSRSYREKLEIDHALAIVKDGARMKFDRIIVDALVKVVSMNGALS